MYANIVCLFVCSERIILNDLKYGGYSYGDIFSVKCTNVRRDNFSLSLSLVSSFFT